MRDKDHAISVLNKTKDRLFEKGWHKGNYGDKNGPTCLAGAFQMVELGNFYMASDFTVELTTYLNKVIEETTSFSWITDFNDDRSTKFDDVITLIETAIKRLESE